MDYSFLTHPIQSKVFRLLIEETNNGKNEFSLSLAQISDRIKITRSQARLALQKLQDLDVIAQTKEYTNTQGNVFVPLLSLHLAILRTKIIAYKRRQE